MTEYRPARPLFWWTVGILLSLAALILLERGGLLLLGAVALCAAGLFLPRTRTVALLAGTAVLAGGAALAVWELSAAPVWALAGQEHPFQGLVLSVEELDGAARYQLYGETPALEGRRILLPVVSFQEELLQPGQEVEGVVAFSRPVDREGRHWLHSQDFLLEGEGALTPSVNGLSSTVRGRVLGLRVAMLQALDRARPALAAGLARALVLSDDSAVEPELLAAMRRCGTAHLLVVSGYHVSLLLGGLTAVFRRLRSPMWVQLLWGGVVLLGFGALVGFTPSVVRALVMGGACLLAQAVGREQDSLTALALAAALLLLGNPYRLLSWSFLLSFVSTLSVLLFTQPILGWMTARARAARRPIPVLVQGVAGTVGVSVAAAVLTFPVQAVMFGWLPLLSPLANLLVAPLVPVLFFGGAAAAFLGLAGAAVPGWLSGICQLAAWLMDGSSRLMASLRGASLPVNDWWMVVWLFGAAAVLLAARAARFSARQARWLVLLAVPLLVGSGLSGLDHNRSIALVAQSDCGNLMASRGGKGAVILDRMEDPDRLEELVLLLDRQNVRRVELLVCLPGAGAEYIAEACRLLEPQAVLLPRGRENRDGLRLPDSIWTGTLEEGRVQLLGGLVCPAQVEEEYLVLEIGGGKVLKLFAGYGIIKDKSPLREVNAAATPGGSLVAMDGSLRPVTLVDGSQRIWIPVE